METGKSAATACHCPGSAETIISRMRRWERKRLTTERDGRRSEKKGSR
jgi:hypothetical protein